MQHLQVILGKKLVEGDLWPEVIQVTIILGKKLVKGDLWPEVIQVTIGVPYEGFTQ